MAKKKLAAEETPESATEIGGKSETETTAKKKAAPKKAAPKKTATKSVAKKAPARKKAAPVEDEPLDEAAIAAAEANARAAKGKNLVIVESPAKAKTIEKYLGKDYKVLASIGHIIDLPVSKLGVDIEHDFAPQYEVIKGKKVVIDNLRRSARAAARVYIATDPDREGEAIANHIVSVVENGDKEIHRAIFNEITRDAVREAIANPGEVNRNLVNAQQARRILDRLVGYKISPLLWCKVQYGLSAGRVQSVALKIICDREREIRAFVPEEYWTIEADARAPKPPPFRLRLDKIEGKKAVVPNKESADAIIGETQGKPFVVGDVIKKEISRRPLPPFITSTLQQEASRKLHLAARRTMQIAQKLYEGVDVGQDGPTGLITYMRTDSTRLSDQALGTIRDHIRKTFGPEFCPDQPRFYAAGKKAQDAHEAIRPTDVTLTPDKLERYLDKEYLAVYRLIWNRAVASQMADAKLDSTRVEVPVSKYLFIATGSVVKFPGHLAVYEEARDEIGKKETEENAEEADTTQEPGANRLPPLEKGDKLDVPKVDGIQHFTQPPPRFTEAGLIKELEKQGIGRPSTYASIISTIQGKDYTIKDKGVFRPTDLGVIVTDMLTGSFPQIMDVKFTAMMEGQLDEVEEGKVNWVELIKNFYLPFEKRLEQAGKHMRNLKAEKIQTDYVCDKCGSPMIVRWGRNGKFLACSAYPNCKSTKPIVTNEAGEIEIVKDEVTDRNCINCGKPMVIKSGKRGRFLACSGYPDCKTSQPLPIGVPCARPGCKGELYERRSAKGRTFYSCSAYPECKYSAWEIPTKQKCETCGQEKFMVGKEGKRKVFGCTRGDCPYPSAYTEEKVEEPTAKT